MAKNTAMVIVSVHAEDKGAMSHALMQIEMDIIDNTPDGVAVNTVTYEFPEDEEDER